MGDEVVRGGNGADLNQQIETMGTRSLTKIISKWEDEQGKTHRRPIACMYRQYDGYLEGHGLDLAQFLEPIKMVSGLSGNDQRKVANGMDCLSAQLIAHFKDGAGNIYLMHPDTKDVWEDFLYEVEKNDKGKFVVTVSDYNKIVIFKGSVKELIKTIDKINK